MNRLLLVFSVLAKLIKYVEDFFTRLKKKKMEQAIEEEDSQQFNDVFNGDDSI